MKNPAAVALGKLARGHKKTYTQAERERRRKSLAEARKKRWERKDHERAKQLKAIERQWIVLAEKKFPR